MSKENSKGAINNNIPMVEVIGTLVLLVVILVVYASNSDKTSLFISGVLFVLMSFAFAISATLRIDCKKEAAGRFLLALIWFSTGISAFAFAAFGR